MNNNDFYVNTQNKRKKSFASKNRILIFITLFFTLPLSFFSIPDIIISAYSKIIYGNFYFNDESSKNIIMNSFCLTLFIISIACITILIRKKPFSKIICNSINLIGIIWIITSIILPRTNDFSPVGFYFMKKGDFVFADGFVLISGIIVFLIGKILYSGFELQSESEEVL